MANRFVIVIKVDDDVNPYRWEVRELLNADGVGSVLERSGPVLVDGRAADLVHAKHDAEVWAEKLSQETVYIYNAGTMEPTPLPSP